MNLPFHEQISMAVFGETVPTPHITGSGNLASPYAVTDLATATIAAAGRALARLTGGDQVDVDRRLASLWFDMTLQPVGWHMPSVWDSIAGNYRGKDRWIRLHTNAPHHRAAALAVLGCGENAAAVADAVGRWDACDLEQAIVAFGGCAATQLTTREWLTRPEGAAIAAEPLIDWQWAGISVPAMPRAHDRKRPLAGVRVLDLTRVLAGPVASRLLAGFGATVLRIDPPHWDEPAVIPEVNPGKYSAGLDLQQPEDRTRFEGLLADADVLLHGYRGGALPGLGYDAAARRHINPGLVDVSLNAYGHTSAWADRRGFDSLVQMTIGITDYGQRQTDAAKPVPLPVQALDHGTGYLLAATVLEGLRQRWHHGRATIARLSLARTGHLLISEPPQSGDHGPITARQQDYDVRPENTDWGPARRIIPPLRVGGIAPHWHMPSGILRRHEPCWPR